MERRGCYTMMLVAGTAGLALSLTWFFYFLPRWKAVLAGNLVRELDHRVAAYHGKTGSWPEGGNTDILLALRGNNPAKEVFIHESDGFPVKANLLVDAWDTPLVVRRGPDGQPVFVSAGPNKKPGDADDVEGATAPAK